MQGSSMQEALYIKGEQYVFPCGQWLAPHRLAGGDCYRLQER
jgi:hypothetical protein